MRDAAAATAEQPHDPASVRVGDQREIGIPEDVGLSSRDFRCWEWVCGRVEIEPVRLSGSWSVLVGLVFVAVVRSTVSNVLASGSGTPCGVLSHPFAPHPRWGGGMELSGQGQLLGSITSSAVPRWEAVGDTELAVS
jgi:hypothetical protein